jgi:1,4-dihydroxy-2-naphthoate octaprenyltransferase
MQPIYASIPLTITVAAILIVNEFPDFEADKNTDRKNLVVLLGRKKARWVYISSLLFLYGYIIVMSIIGALPIYSLLTLISFPPAVYAIDHILKYYDSPYDMIPSYVSTIITHLTVGFLLVISYLFNAIQSIFIISSAIALIGLYIIYEIYQVNRDLKAFLLIKDHLS